nr:integrase, catalytic region, zinc finger, CCHC-type, peptidase aspartic, catalytic [Tanacetum cinerariifolium]
SFSDEDSPKEIYSNPVFNEEINSMKIDPYHFNADSDLIESLLNHDSSIISSLKIDSLFDEFASELTLLKSIPSGINETDCDPEEETHYIKRFLYDNSSPHPPEEFVYENSDAEIESSGSESRPPMLNKENYVPWSSRLLCYAKSRPNGKLIHNSIINGPYVRRMILNQLRVQQMMKGFDIGIQEKKAKLFNKWERFTSNKMESIEYYYHHFLKLMNDLKRNKHFLKKIATDYTQLYDFLKYNQKEVDELKAERLVKSQDPLALMATSNNPYNFPVLNEDQPSFNQDYMQQLMPNPEDIIDPTTAINMALALMAKAFKLNYSTPTNNNQRFHQTHAIGRLHNRNVRNLNGYNVVQNVRNQVAQNPRVHNVGNQNGLIGVLGNGNQNGNGNLVAARAEGNAAGHNGNQIRCYNCRGVGHFARNYMVRPRRMDAAYLQTQLLIAQREEAQPSTSGTQTDKAPIYDSDESAEVHDYENCYDNEIFNMFTQEEQYTELLEPIHKPHQLLQNDNNVIYEVTSVEQSGETVEQHLANFEETRALYDSLYHNLAIEVEKVNTVKRKKEKVEADFKTCEDELLDKQIYLEKKIKELNNILVKMGQSIQTIHILSPKPDSFYHTEQKMALGYQNPFYLKQAQKKQQSLYDGKVLLKKHDPPIVHDSEETLQLAQESREKMKQLNKEIKTTNYIKINHLSGVFVSQTAKSREELYFSNDSKTDNVSKSISIPNEEFLDDTTPSVARKFLNEVKSTIVTLHRVVKQRITLETHNWSSSAHQELHKIVKDKNFPIVNQVDARVQNFEIQFLNEAAKFVGDFKSLEKETDESLAKHKALELEIERLLRAVVSQDIMFVMQKDSVVDKSNLQTELERTKEHFENCIIKKENEYAIIWNDWYKKCDECKFEKNSYDKAYKDIQQKIERLQAQLRDLKGKSKDTSGIDNTKTRRPQPRSNTKNDRVPSASKSSRSKNKGAEIEEHHRNLLLSKNTKHMSSACYPDLFMVCRLGLFQAHDRKSKASHQFCLEVYGTVHFKNDHVAIILGFGQFCDSDLEVTFRRNACFVKNVEGVDLLKGDRSTNLYTINLHEMASASPICLMARASSTKSRLWHQRLSYLNFDTINDLARNDLVSGLPKFEYHKEHLCPSCEQGKSKRAFHPPKPVPNSSVGISHQMSSVRTPQQNRVVKRQNRTLVEAARTMLIFSRAPLFLWAEAIATACFTQNRSIIHRRFNKTPYELINSRKPDIYFLHVFEALCYPKNDREDIGKLSAKGDIGFFIGYSADSCAYRVYNRRTKKIMETMNVSFDELQRWLLNNAVQNPGFKVKENQEKDKIGSKPDKNGKHGEAGKSLK